MDRLKADATRIFASFARAFIAGIGVTQIADVQDMRGWTGVLTAAVVAGIAAALRTAETLLPASTPTPDGGN
jgi:hypothetical protein